VVDAILLDSPNPKIQQVGGTRYVQDWNISDKIIRESPIPAILAGGLTPKNVAQAIQTVSLYGMDVNIGVENRKGGKS